MTFDVPDWLVGTWKRSYIRRDGGPPDSSVAVRYVQTSAAGHAFDLRVAQDFHLPGEVRSTDDLSLEQLQLLASGVVECFAGMTTAEPHAGGEQWTVSWHGAFLFPPLLNDSDGPLLTLASIAAGSHETSDVGVAIPTQPASRRQPVARWLEHAPDGSYEEEWLLDECFRIQGAHLAAVCPARSGEGGARWLAILGNTFGFVRDVDRAALPAAARNRPAAQVLSDDAVPLEAKRRLLDCDFSFGTFGQGGRVGGVVERSSLPWRRGGALGPLLGKDLSRWEPVRASDGPALLATLRAIQDDHSRACAELREAKANGQAGLVDLLTARGAISQ